MTPNTKLCPLCLIGNLHFSKLEKLVYCDCGYSVDLDVPSYKINPKEGYANFSQSPPTVS